MSGLLSAARYVPRGRRRGPGVAAGDEDVFTMAAAVVEPLLSEPPTNGPALPVELVGPFAADTEWAFRALLARPLELVRSEGGAPVLLDAIRRAEAARVGPRLVVVAERRGRGRSELPAEEPSEDGAAAFLFGEGGVPLASHLSGLETGRSGLAAARKLGRMREGNGTAVSWIGDWTEGSPGSEGASPEPTPTADADLRAVSEGAYVPRPRYVENLPSRWRFVAEECPACGTTTFPARRRCRGCGRGEGLRPRALPRDGALVVAATVIGPGGQPTEFDPQVAREGPYEVVLAELAPGQRVTLQLTDAEPGSVRIGDRVDTRLRRLYPMEGEWRYGRKAVPQRERTARSG